MKTLKTRTYVVIFGILMLIVAISIYISIKPNTPCQDTDYTIPDLGMKFVYVAPGSFQMGYTYGRHVALQYHKATISMGYWIGKYEVTQEEYLEIMGSIPSNSKGKNKPVEMVSWNNAVEFCRKLTRREWTAGLLASNCEYRLPTEAEWEFAARGGIKSLGCRYSGSNKDEDVAWSILNAHKRTRSVGTKAANELGIHDMTGNVAEWCMDWKADYPTTSVTDYMQLPTRKMGTWLYHVIRGGSAYDYANITAYRSGYMSRVRSEKIGFRIVRTIP